MKKQMILAFFVFVLILAFAAAVFAGVGWLCALFFAAVFNIVQPWWVFAIGWFLLASLIRMVRGETK